MMCSSSLIPQHTSKDYRTLWEADSPSANQETLRLIWDHMIVILFTSTPLGPILSQFSQSTPSHPKLSGRTNPLEFEALSNILLTSAEGLLDPPAKSQDGGVCIFGRPGDSFQTWGVVAASVGNRIH
jgi:hypothetical protein